MLVQPGFIILLGSGETAPTMQKVYDWLFKQLVPPVSLAIVETPAGFQPNSAQVAGDIADFITQRLQNYHPAVSVIPARRREAPFSTDDPALLADLLRANVIFMGPGSPTYAVRHLRDSRAWHTITARHRLGTALIFASAGTIAVGAQALPVYEIYKAGADLHWQPGLNLLAPFGLPVVFMPHWNNTDGGEGLDTSRCYMGRQRFKQLVGLLPEDIPLVGIDEHTALAFNPTAQTGQVMGNGGVTLMRGGQEKIFESGQSFDLSELGPFRLPAPAAGIPSDIWQWVEQTLVQADQQPAPDPALLILVDRRTDARARKDWSTADALRADIEAQGWQVLDTPSGPVLQPIND